MYDGGGLNLCLDGGGLNLCLIESFLLSVVHFNTQGSYPVILSRDDPTYSRGVNYFTCCNKTHVF